MMDWIKGEVLERDDLQKDLLPGRYSFFLLCPLATYNKGPY